MTFNQIAAGNGNVAYLINWCGSRNGTTAFGVEEHKGCQAPEDTSAFSPVQALNKRSPIQRAENTAVRAWGNHCDYVGLFLASVLPVDSSLSLFSGC